jgi:N-acetylglucosaminyldiphosphoundecaprenol N-acetyl-beta-D-mannosaminyltransferase
MAIGALPLKRAITGKPAAPAEPITPEPALDALDSGAYTIEFRRRIELGGVRIDRVDLAAAVDRIRGFLGSGKPHQVVTVNLDFLSIAERQSEFRNLINECDLAVADGMPLLWVSRLQRHALPERVTGVDLVAASCRIAEEKGHGVFLLGAGPGVADAAARALQLRYPRLRIAGVYTPPFGPLTPEEDERIVRMIQEAAPGILLVALGAPRQDQWIRAHRDQLNVPVAMGVGCVFDLLAGVVDRAPTWMQHAGLEWAFRLGQEPTRLWRRYIVNDIPTLGRLLMASLRESDLEEITELLVSEPAVPEAAAGIAP